MIFIKIMTVEGQDDSISLSMGVRLIITSAEGRFLFIVTYSVEI